MLFVFDFFFAGSLPLSFKKSEDEQKHKQNQEQDPVPKDEPNICDGKVRNDSIAGIEDPLLSGKESESSISVKPKQDELKQDHISVKQDDLSTKKDGISTKQDDLSTKQDGLSTKQEDLSTKQDDLSTKQDGYSTKQDPLSRLLDLTRQDDLSMKHSENARNINSKGEPVIKDAVYFDPRFWEKPSACLPESESHKSFILVCVFFSLFSIIL